MGYKRKTGRKYKRATQANHKVLKAFCVSVTSLLTLVTFTNQFRKHKKG